MSNSSESLWSRLMHNKSATFLTIMIVAVPLVLTPIGLNCAGFGAMSTNVMAAVLLIVVALQTKWRFERAKAVTFLKTGANGPVLIFLALALLSFPSAPNKVYAAAELLHLGSGILVYFVAAHYIRRSEQMTRLIDALLFVAGTVAIVGFIQMGSSDRQPYATGIFGDHQLFGSFMMLLLPLTAVVAVMDPMPRRRVAAQVSAMLTVIALLVSHGRSAWLGAATGVGVLALLALYIACTRSHHFTGRNEFVVPVLLLVVSCGGFILLSPISRSLLARATTLGDVQADRGWRFRSTMARGAIGMIETHPVFGLGIGSYPYLQNSYTHTGLAIPSMAGNVRPTLNNTAHNYILQTGAELGGLGLLAFGAILATFLFHGLRMVRELDNGMRRTILLGSFGAVSSFTVDALGSPSWQFGQVSIFFWLMLGLGVGCLRPRSRRPARDEIEFLSHTTLVIGRLVGVAIGILILVGIPILASKSAFSEAEFYTPKSARIAPIDATDAAVGPHPRYRLFVTFDTMRDDRVEFELTAANSIVAGKRHVVEFTTSAPDGVFQDGSTFVGGNSAGGVYRITGSYSQVNGDEQPGPTFADTQVCVETPGATCTFTNPVVVHDRNDLK